MQLAHHIGHELIRGHRSAEVFHALVGIDQVGLADILQGRCRGGIGRGGINASRFQIVADSGDGLIDVVAGVAGCAIHPQAVRAQVFEGRIVIGAHAGRYRFAGENQLRNAARQHVHAGQRTDRRATFRQDHEAVARHRRPVGQTDRRRRRAGQGNRKPEDPERTPRDRIAVMVVQRTTGDRAKRTALAGPGGYQSGSAVDLHRHGGGSQRRIVRRHREISAALLGQTPRS